jgi:hypothetical protein
MNDNGSDQHLSVKALIFNCLVTSDGRGTIARPLGAHPRGYAPIPEGNEKLRKQVVSESDQYAVSDTGGWRVTKQICKQICIRSWPPTRLHIQPVAYQKCLAV